MTTAETQHARPGRVGQAWRDFRRWRRARPFWGGLFTALAGLEIFGTTQMSLNGLTFKMGPTGFLTWLIPAILITCGLLLWFSPPQRIFYSVVAAVTAVYSLIGVNLGGFLIGLLLGMVGSALGFAWVPRKEASATEAVTEAAGAAGPDEPEPALVDDLLPRQREDETTGVLTDTLPEPRNPLREAAGAPDSTQVLPAVPPEGPEGTGRRDPKLYAILLVLATVSAAGLFALRDGRPALAAPVACPTASSPAPRPSTSESASPSPTASPDTAATESAATDGDDGNLLTDIIDGITGLFTGGGSGDAGTEPAPAPQPTGTATTAAEPAAAGATPTESATSATPDPSASTSATPSAPAKPDAEPCASPAPTKPKPVEEGKPLPRIAAEPGQPPVANPSKLTGSKTEMWGLRFEGIVELPYGDGTLKALKFTMDQAVTDDFVLQSDGPAGRTLRYVTDQLTVKGDRTDRVQFYATRFSARFLGVKVTLTPDLPFPDGLPITSPLPLTFTDPVIDLAFVDSKILTAKPALKLDLA